MNVVAGIGGPPVALYALNAGWRPERARPTLQSIFLVANLVALVSLGLPRGRALALGPALLAALAAGWLTGRAVARKVPDGAVRGATLAVAALGGVVAAADALL